MCSCKPGYYFPDTSAAIKYFNGSDIDAEYDKYLQGNPNNYHDGFECLKCSEGCTECEDDSPCVYDAQGILWIALIVVDGCMMLLSLVFGMLVFIHRDNKVRVEGGSLFLLTRPALKQL